MYSQNTLFCDTTQVKYHIAYDPSDSSYTLGYNINSRIFPNDSNMIQEVFYKNGIRKSFSTYINDHVLNGVSINYYSNGKIKNVSYYLYGLIVGGFTEWHENGKIKIRGNYWADIQENNIEKIDSTESDEHKKNQIKFLEKKIVGLQPYNFKNKNGIWYYYDDQGKLIKRENWNKGVLIDTNK